LNLFLGVLALPAPLTAEGSDLGSKLSPGGKNIIGDSVRNDLRGCGLSLWKGSVPKLLTVDRRFSIGIVLP
jgi:hypothetical protein